MNDNSMLKYFAYLFAVGAFFDAATTMLGTHSILSDTASGSNKSFVIGVALVFALLITIIVASSGYLLRELNNNVFKQFVVLPTVIAAFVYDFYTSALGVTGLITGESPDLFNIEDTNVLLVIIFLSLFMSLSPFIATTLWSSE